MRTRRVPSAPWRVRGAYVRRCLYKMAHFKRSHVAIPTATFAMVLGLGLAGVPMNAYGVTSAELQQQLDAASEQLNKLYSQAEQAGYDLHSVQSDLEATKESIVQTEAEIEEEQAQLVELQKELGVLATNQYKGGSLNLFSLLFNADSFDSLVSSMRYADKAAEHQQGVISQSKELQQSLAEKKASLEADRDKQEKLVAEQKVKADAASAAASDAQAYYNQLSDEVKAKIREEQEAAREKARQEAEEARKKAELEAQQQAQQGGSNSSGGGSSQSGSGGSSQGGNTGGGSTGGSTGSGSGSTGGGSTGGGSTGGGSTGSGSTGGGSHTTSSAARTMVNRAWGIIGSGYSYSGYKWTGDPNTSWFTCSGVIDYALGLGTNSNSPESLYAAVGSNLTTDRSKLAYGDLVFFRHAGRTPGHVGIYIGNDQMIDSIPGSGVGTRDLDYIGGFIGGGPIV